MQSALANLYSSEGTLAGATTITFPWRSRQLVLTNDSATLSITVTIAGATLTLKPTETLTANMFIPKIGLNGTGNYRLWVFG